MGAPIAFDFPFYSIALAPHAAQGLLQSDHHLCALLWAVLQSMPATNGTLPVPTGP